MMHRLTLFGLVLLVVTPLAATPGATIKAVGPVVFGTVVDYPYLGGLSVRDTTRMASYCFETTATNLEYNRGFMEFELPPLPKRIVQATLIITETRNGTSSFPVPPEVHELGAYPADLVLDTADYDVAVTPIATFETDVNDPPDLKQFRFDVTAAVQQMRMRKKTTIGFRIKLQIDPAGPCPGFTGSDFNDAAIARPMLVVAFRGGGE